MKGTSCRAIALVLAGWYAAAGDVAADPVPVESVRPASGLGAAREELDTVKGAGQADEVRVGMPAVALPQLHQPPDPENAPRRKPSAGRPGVAPKGDNWLLEGMAREKALAEKSGRSPRDPRDRDRPSRTRTGFRAEGSDGGEGDPVDADDAAMDPGAVEQADAINTLNDPVEAASPVALPDAPVANPLANFLGDWLSPKDHDLLRSTLGPSGSASSREGYGAGAIESANPVIAGMAAPGRTEADGTGAKPMDNPFLAFLQAPEAGAPAMPAPAPAVRSEPLPPPAQVEPPPVPRSRTPDFVRPLQDEKYYKPLKRF